MKVIIANIFPFVFYCFFISLTLLGEYYWGEKTGVFFSYFLTSYYIFPIWLFFINIFFHKQKKLWLRFLVAMGMACFFLIFAALFFLLYAKLRVEMGMGI